VTYPGSTRLATPSRTTAVPSRLMDNQGEYQTRAAIGVQIANVPSHDNLRQQYRRRNEDVDYWRHRSGWFDDDQAMRDYNNGVYDAYYQPDGENQKGASGGRLSATNLDVKKIVIRSLVALFLLGICIFMYRLVSRRFGGSTDDSKEKRKRSSSRERSGSRSRSRSRSRKGGDYDLMSEDEDGKSSRSKGSHRSRSKSGRSASRTRTRSRSTSRKESSSTKPSPSAAEAILV
jgi:hypothetical protein